MNRRYLVLALLIAASAARADSWTYVGTLNDYVDLADGQYEARITLLQSGTAGDQEKASVRQQISIESGSFSLALELGEALQASPGQAADSLVLTTEISSDGVHFVAISLSSRFDAASAQRGVCWGADDADSTSQTSQIGTACLLPTDLLAQMVPAGGAYEIRKQVIAGGGRLVTGGSYALTGTFGQSAVTQVSGGVYQLTGGFHSAAVAGPVRPDLVFKNGFEN